MNRPRYPLTIYYDGACRVCAAEIGHYLRRDRAGRLAGVDISAPDFDPTPLGATLDEMLYQLHAVDAGGTVYRNIVAFVAIWQSFPDMRFRLLVVLFSSPLVAPLARCGYRLFARVRRYLPSRDRCADDSCRLGRQRPSSRR